MKPAVLIPLCLLAGLAGGYKWGRQSAGRAMATTAVTAAATTGSSGAEVPTAMPRPGPQGAAPASAVAGQKGKAVQSLLSGFNRKKPVESNLKILQKILASSPEQLAQIVRDMAGPWRNDPGWAQAKQAALQRWVEIAPDAALAWARSARKDGAEPHDVAGVYGALAETNPLRAFAEARALQSPSLQQSALHSVIDAIAQTDPQQALQLSADLPNSLRHNVTWAIFNSWARLDPAGAAAGLDQLQDGNQRRNGVHSVMSQWAERDPEAALAWIKAVPEANLRRDAMTNLFSRLGQRDPQQAVAMAENLTGPLQRQVHTALLGGWVQSDPEAVDQWIRSRPDGGDKQELIKFALNFTEALTPERAAALAGTLKPGPNRDEAMQNLLRHWGQNDPAQARAFMDTLPETEQKRLIPTVVESLAQNNPEEAIAYLKVHPIDDPTHHIWRNLAGIISDQSTPEKALAWARELPDEVTQRRVIPEIMGRLASQDPQTAAREALNLTSAAAREDSLARIGMQWGNDNFQEALGWARSLTGKDRENALGAVMNQGANQDPSTVATQFSSLLAELPANQKPADSLINAASTIANSFFAESQEKATAWVASLTQDDARASATQALASRWVNYDAVSASEWIGSLPGGKSRDLAVSSLVGGIADTDPAMAFEWANTTQEESTRSSLLERSLQSWRQLDPEAARTTILNTDWPEETKTRWLEKLR